MNTSTKIILLIIIVLLISSLFSQSSTWAGARLVEHISHEIKHNRNSIKEVLKQESGIRLPHVEQTGQIPKIIFQTHKKIELIPDYYIENLKTLNKDWEYRFFDNQDAKTFLREEFGKEFDDKFDYFKSGPHKADLWRVCVLYKYGGCYLDADIELYKSFDYIINEIKEDFIVAETLIGFNKKRIFNALMICKPGDELIGECIKKIMLVENKYLEHDYHYIIYLMNNILEKKMKHNKLLEKYIPSSKINLKTTPSEYYVTIDNEKIAKSKRDDY